MLHNSWEQWEQWELWELWAVWEVFGFFVSRQIKSGGVRFVCVRERQFTFMKINTTKGVK